VNGNCAWCALAACLISEPVGPLTGRVEHAAKLSTEVENKIARRNSPLRLGTHIIDI